MPTIKKPRNISAPEHGTEADSVDNLILSHRGQGGLRAALINAGITGDAATVGAAKGLSGILIMRSPNVGRATVREIRAEIERYLKR